MILYNSGNIFLIGPMAVGKSTIGKQLAAKTGKIFIDSDHAIEQKTGVDIALIFEIEGEQGFRKRETKMIEELTSKNNIILATGGGAVISEYNRECIKKNATVIYLKSSAETILKRTARDKKRPLLQITDRLEKIESLLAQRSPLYEEIADIIFETDKGSVKEIVKQILRTLNLTCDS